MAPFTKGEESSIYEECPICFLVKLIINELRTYLLESILIFILNTEFYISEQGKVL
jgi:hypothetical protein